MGYVGVVLELVVGLEVGGLGVEHYHDEFGELGVQPDLLGVLPVDLDAVLHESIGEDQHLLMPKIFGGDELLTDDGEDIREHKLLNLLAHERVPEREGHHTGQQLRQLE